MQVDLSYINKNSTVAIALSGGGDSMALLHYTLNTSEKYGFNVIALNIEHGIRGESSKKDSLFVENYCKQNSIPLLRYDVDSLKRSKEKKLSIEHAARELRYECFFDALNSGKCDYVATAHHLKDNAESVLINLFRGTGIKGLRGINEYKGKIIRPFLGVKKEEIEEYLKDNAIPFVTDETNSDDEYTRNFIRLNLLPEIKKIFPEVETSLYRLSEIASLEDEYLDKQAFSILSNGENSAKISLPNDKAILARAVIFALKRLGIEKDWEKIHVDDVISLADKENGKRIVLPKNTVAYKEYDGIVIVKDKKSEKKELPFKTGKFEFGDDILIIESVNAVQNLKDGLYLDGDKIPENSVIRVRGKGDTFTKFGGGTKSLGDFLTDKKIPLRERDGLPLIACENEVFAVFGVAVSDKTKIDFSTEKFIKITKVKKEKL